MERPFKKISRGSRLVQCLKARGLTRKQIRAKARNVKGNGCTPDDFVLFVSEALRIPPHILEMPYKSEKIKRVSHADHC